MAVMASSSALQPDRCCLHLAVAAPRRLLLRLLPPRAPPLSLLSHRRRVVRFSTGDRGGGGGSGGAVEKRSVPIPKKRGEEEEEGLVAVAADGGKLELRYRGSWAPPPSHSSSATWTRTVLKVGVLAWSFATAVIPAVVEFMPGLVLSRILLTALKNEVQAL